MNTYLVEYLEVDPYRPRRRMAPNPPQPYSREVIAESEEKAKEWLAKTHKKATLVKITLLREQGFGEALRELQENLKDREYRF